MLFEVTYINNKNILKKFITSGENEDKCIDIAKKYIKENGGTSSVARMSKLSKLPN